jgi:hypothetical protein
MSIARSGNRQIWSCHQASHHGNEAAALVRSASRATHPPAPLCATASYEHPQTCHLRWGVRVCRLPFGATLHAVYRAGESEIPCRYGRRVCVCGRTMAWRDPQPHTDAHDRTRVKTTQPLPADAMHKRSTPPQASQQFSTDVNEPLCGPEQSVHGGGWTACMPHAVHHGARRSRECWLERQRCHDNILHIGLRIVRSASPHALCSSRRGARRKACF